ncbi:MAG: hypothetical protein ACTSRI_17435 [Promethearchaeota archaeon]
MLKEIFKKRKNLVIIGLFGFVLIAIALISFFFFGPFSISTVLEALTPPLIIFMALQFFIPILLLLSLFSSKKLKPVLRRSALIILISLVGFYIFIPYIPVQISPNHEDSEWNSGSVVHILPTVSDNRILLKVSFEIPLDNPYLKVNERSYQGMQMDTKGYYWCFDAKGLSSNRKFILYLVNKNGNSLCDPWPLKTFPSPDSRPSNLRILAFTGSGGHDACRTWYGMGQEPLEIRKKLLNKALSFEPDILIGTGDQIYYDIKYGIGPKTMGQSRRAIQYSGKFDMEKAVLGTENEDVLKNAVDNQISYLYGTECRSIPSFFILDDHDYFVNDEAREKDEINPQLLMIWEDPFIEGGVSFPPDPFMLELGRAAQKLYLPEYLPDENRPQNLPATRASDRASGVSECFGTIRYGRLFEGLLYDTRRYITLKGDSATFIPLSAENWIKSRMTAEETDYVANISPISYGWSAGKWLSWYPDVKTTVNGVPVLTKNISKYMWQEGWFKQHNRILKATSYMEKSTPFFVCGDMHTQAAGRITRSGNLDFTDNPIPSILIGSLGADGGSYPSGGIRGIEAQPPVDLEVEEKLPSYEKSGFVIIDINTEKVVVRFYGWRMDIDPVSAIDTLEAHHTFVISRIKNV